MRLLIQFSTPELTDFRWALFDEATGRADYAWQHAGEADLGSITLQNPHPVILVLPQQCVYLTEVELPEKASRQVISAIEFQVEDQLAQDIESQHFALGNPNENPISIAVVERDIMQRCLDLAQSLSLRLLHIVPEVFLCPWPGEGVVLTAGQGGYLLRYGACRALKCQAQALPAMLELVEKDIPFETITYYGGTGAPTPELEGYTVERRELAEVSSGLVDAPRIDLQQRDFKLSAPWQGLARAWKWTGVLLLTLLVIGGYNRAMALQQLEAELDSIKQQQFQLLRPYLPAGTSPEDNLKKLMVQRMNELQASQREQGFLKLMLDFTEARKKFPDVRISRIGYQGSRLAIEISSSQLTDIEAMLETVRKSGANAKLESLNIKPEQSSGRLVIAGGSDG